MFEQQIVHAGEISLNFAHGPASGPPLLFLPGVGRLIHWMQTETTLRLVLNFLESLNE